MLNKIIQELRNQVWIKALLRISNVYLIGGSVRDAYLNFPLKDIDVVVEGISLEDIQNAIRHYGKMSLVGESFEVIKFRPRGHTGEDYDIAVCREDRKTGKGHKDFDVNTKGVTILDDLRRRDFTVNSIAVNIRNGEILDPFNGVQDIKSKVLRATDHTAFTEDALRIIRGIQFAARFKFSIEPRTLKMMKSNAHLLKEISGERILGELEKILFKRGSTKLAFELMYETDIDKVLFGKKFISNEFDSFDNLDPASFFFILGTLGNVSPSKFYASKLKGNTTMITALLNLEKYFDKFDSSKPEKEIKWNVFLMLKGSPQLENSIVLPANVRSILKEMKKGKIPMKLGDIPVSGVDLMDYFEIPEGRELGLLIVSMYQDALMNKFNWKNKQQTLKYLEKWQ